MYGSYNNTLDDVILGNYQPELDWMKTKGKVNPYGWDYVSLYEISGSKLNHANFKAAALFCFQNRIRLGIAWSDPSQIDQVIAYNNSLTDFRSRIYFMTSELEAEYGNNNCTVAEYRKWIKDVYPKLQAARILSLIYEGWNYNYDISVPYSDGFWLHAYRTAAQMVSPDDMWNYINTGGTPDRMMTITAEAKKINKRVSISLLTSAETSYGADFYKTRPWGSALPIVLNAFGRKATADQERYIDLDGEIVFTSSKMKPIKP